MRTSTKYLIGIFFVITIPTVLALGWAWYSQDPTVRPLGITKEALDQHSGEAKGIQIVTRITWNPDRQSAPKALARAIQKGFAAKGVETTIEMVAKPGGPASVTYDIGASHIGPVAHSEAAQGIRAAVEAYRMNVPFNSDPDN
ncbi:hypothetical protein [Aliiroseovarius marinus]|uniref:hypothetical protein n=1 Tax=Aliiroseovarius marinus TaxID=2500159 RepID=UPI003D7C607F